MIFCAANATLGNAKPSKRSDDDKAALIARAGLVALACAVFWACLARVIAGALWAGFAMHPPFIKCSNIVSFR